MSMVVQIMIIYIRLTDKSHADGNTMQGGGSLSHYVNTSFAVPENLMELKNI